MMALVDTISSFPADDPGREPLLAQLERDAATVTRLQDASSGLWFDVLDKGRERGNYLESSASAMFIYTLARGVRLGYLPAHYAANADRAYRGFVSRFLQPEGATSVFVSGSTEAVGLGGQPYGDGSFESYVAAKVAADDPVAEGVFLLASSEMEDLPLAHLGRGRTVLLDAWFNSQTRQDAFGTPVSYHYKWDDRSDSGFSTLGHIFNNFGIDTRTLVSVPFVETLRHAQIYIIASPDSLAANPQANTIRSEDVSEIVQWVKEGGVLVIMANNSTSADLTHLNLLSERFGIRFNDVLRSHVDDSKWEMGKIIIAGSGPLFRYPHSLFMKDTWTLSVRSPAGALLSDHGNGLMAQAKFGRGMVLATVSPWLTNEFTDGRKLPREYDNYAAGQEMVRWLLGQIP
jgi:unsaturated rhamnogalacturonyl hydrolase